MTVTYLLGFVCNGESTDGENIERSVKIRANSFEDAVAEVMNYVDDVVKDSVELISINHY